MLAQSNNFTLIFTLSIFLLVKLTLLLVGMEHFFHVEEIYRALIAKSIIDGIPFSLFDLQVDTYSGGSLVVGLLLVPVFIVFGQSLFSIKLVALFFSMLIVAALHVLCKKYFDEKTAVIACLLFTFSPPLVTKYFFFCMGFHVESVLFSMLFMLVFFKIFCAEKYHSTLWFAVLGFIGGFGLWFTYVFAVTLMTGLIFWFAAERLFFLRRRFLFFAAGFLIGFSPWIYSHLFYHLSGAPLNTKKLLPALSLSGLRAAGEKLLGLPAAIGNPYLFNDYYHPGYRIAQYFYCLSGAAALVVLIARNRRHIVDFLRALLRVKNHVPLVSLRSWTELFFIVYLFMFVAAYLFSGFAVNDYMDYFGYRYLIPFYFFFMVVMALWCARIQNAKAGNVFTALLLCTGIAGNLQYVGFKNITLSVHEIDDYYCLYESLTNKKIARAAAAGSFDRCLVFARTLDPKYLGQFYLGLGELTGGLFIKAPEQYHALYSAVDKRFRTMFFMGAAKAIILMHGDIEKGISFIKMADPQHWPRLYRMLGISIGFRNTKNPEKAFAIIGGIEERYRDVVYEGLGYFFGFCAPLHRPDIGECIKIFDKADPAYNDLFGLSFGSLGRYFVLKRYSLAQCLNMIWTAPETYKPHLYRALGAHYMRDRNCFDDCRTVVAKIEQPYLSFFYEGMGLGIQDDQWLFSGLVAKRTKQIYFNDISSRTAFYKGLATALHHQTIFALDDEQQQRLLRREGVQSG